MKKKILILGHNGLLGSTVLKYLSLFFDIETNPFRVPSKDFIRLISESNADWVINCIGLIPQNNPNATLEDYIRINYLVPKLILSYFRGRMINPATDCEFSGNNSTEETYSIESYRDVPKDDLYGWSKKHVAELLETATNKERVVQIRTSIIGPHKPDGKSLWDWFVNNPNKEVNGYTNHIWNGITTLEWARFAKKIIDGDIELDRHIFQLGTSPISKYDLLIRINNILNLDKIILPVEHQHTVNKSLQVDFDIPSIETQIKNANIFNTYLHGFHGFMPTSP